MPDDNGVVEKVAARLTLDISPAQKQLLQLAEDIKSTLGDSALSAGLVQVQQQAQQVNDALAKVKKQVADDGSRTFIINAQSQLVSLRDALKNIQLQFKEGRLEAEQYIKAIEGLRQTYSGDFSGSNPTAFKNDMLIRQAILQAQQEISRLQDYELEAERRIEQQYARIQAENARRDLQAQAESINNQLRQIREFYNMKLTSAEQSLQRIKRLMDEEAEYFAQNEAKKLEAMKLTYKIQSDMAAQQAARSQQVSFGPVGNVADRALGTAAGLALFQAVNWLMEIPRAAMEAQDSLVKLKQVLELTPSQQDIQRFGSLDGMLKQLQQTAGIMSQIYGVDVNVVLDAMSLVGRRFKDVADIVVATDTALQLYAVDNVNVETAVRGVEAMMSQYGMNMEQARQALFELTAASHAFQVTATDLVQAIERSGSSFKVLKANSAESMAAIATMANLTAQSGSIIGNAWKSIEASMTSDQGQKALKQLGIEIFDAQGKMKNFADVLVELQKKWPKLSDAAKVHFAEVLAGGKYQYERLLTFLNDYSQQYQKALDVIKQANAEVQQKLVETALESPSKQLDMTKASFETLANTIMQSATPAIISFLTAVRRGTHFINEHWGSIEQWLEKGAKLAGAYIMWKVALGTWNSLVKLGTTQQLAMNGALVEGSAAATAFGTATLKAGFSLETFAKRVTSAVWIFLLLNAAYQTFLDLTGQNTEGMLQSKINALEEMKKDHTTVGQLWEDLKKLDVLSMANDIWTGMKYGIFDHVLFGTQDIRDRTIQSEIDKTKAQLAQIQAEKQKKQEEEIKQSLEQMNKIIEESMKQIDKNTPPPPAPGPNDGSLNIDPNAGKGRGHQYQDVTGGPYADTINQYAHQYGIDPQLVRAVAMQESSLGRASSNVMQVNGMDGASPEASIQKGTEMLADLLKRTNGNIKEALAAYNMGPGILDYFDTHGGYSVENMYAFSNMMKQKYGYSVYGDPEYVNHVLRYYNGSGGGGGLSDAEASAEVAKPYKDAVQQMNNELQPFVDRNKELDAIVQELTTHQQTLSDVLKHGSTNAGLISDATDTYKQKLEALKLEQNSLHQTNDKIRADMAAIQQKIHELNPNNADLLTLSPGTQKAIQSLMDEYNKLSQEADQNGKKWWEAQKDITQATLDWLSAIYQLEQNGLTPLSDAMHQNDNDLKMVQQDMSLASDDMKRHQNDTQALTKYLQDYHKEVTLLNQQNDLLHQSNDLLRADNEDLRNRMNEITELFKSGQLTVDAYDAAMQSLNQQIQKNNDEIAKNTDQWYQNITAIQKANDEIQSMIADYLKTAYELEQKMTENKLDEQFNKQKQYLEQLKQSSKEYYDTTIKGLEDQKNAIDDVINSLKQEWQTQDELNKLNDLQNQLANVMSQKDHEIIDVNGNRTFTYDVQKANDLQKQIADEQTKIQRDQQKQQLENQKKALDQQIQQLRDFEQKQQDEYDKQLQDLQESYDKQKQALDEYWQDRLSQDRLNTDAENLILQQGYDKALQNTKNFVDQMKGQFNALQQNVLATGAAIAAAMGATMPTGVSSGSSSSSTSSSSSSSHSSSNSGSNNSNGNSSTNKSTNSSGSTHVVDSVTQNKNGTWTTQWHDPKTGQTGFTTTWRKPAQMATGGEIPKGKEGLVYLHENEVVLNSPLTNRLREVLYSTPKFVMPEIEMPKFTMPRFTVPSVMNQVVKIDRLEFPNVRDASDARSFVQEFTNITKQAYFNSLAGGMS